MATYDKEIDYINSEVYLKLKDRSIYGSSRVGVRSTDIDMLALHNPNYSMKSVKYEIGKRTYELSNHLGNVLSVISDKVIPSFEGGNLVGMLADVRVAQDYSPFGVILSGRDFEVDGGYRYGFNSMEKDDEIKGKGNSVNYTYRMHDPRLGRFFAVDPLSAEYPHNSPYAFSENVVINAVELEGREKNYVYNSAYLSAKALAVIQTQTYDEVKTYMDNLVGAKFDNSKNLKYAKEKLGKKIDDAPGYRSDGRTPLSYGNRAVKEGAGEFDIVADYFFVRLVIDNGNGTWSIKNLIVANYSEKINAIEAKIEDLDKKITKRINSLQEKLEKDQLMEEEMARNREMGNNDTPGTIGSFGGIGKLGGIIDLAKSLYDARTPNASTGDKKLNNMLNKKYELKQSKKQMNKNLSQLKEKATNSNSELIIK